jgi:hypothetical protein
MGLLCGNFDVVIFVVCLVMGRFKDVFDAMSSTWCLIMRFVVFSSCVVFHLGWHVVAMFLYCPFVVWVGDVGFDAIPLVVVITAMVSLMIL